jgi:hypothetical protein
MGVVPRPGDELWFGDLAAALVERTECSLLFVATEPTRPSPARDSRKSESGRALADAPA